MRNEKREIVRNEGMRVSEKLVCFQINNVDFHINSGLDEFCYEIFILI